VEKSDGFKQCSNDKSVLLNLLKKQQENYYEGSFEWYDLDAKINQIYAENYLQYVNNR